MKWFDRTRGLTGLVAAAAWIFAAGCSEETSAPPSPPVAPHPLQSVLDGYRTANNIVGLSAAVKKPGRDTWLGASGISHAGHPVTTDMLFRMGSVTKTYVAVVTVRLAERGLFSLDDRITRLLPDVRQYPPDPDNIDSTITVRQLLNHSSGLYNYLDSNALAEDMENNPEKLWAPEELLAYVYGPVFAPGGGFFYSNTGYVLLGMLINETTGSDSLSSQLQEHIFDVVGTENTFLASEQDKPDGTVIAHGWNLRGEIDTEDWKPYYSAAWAAGGMTSTAEESAEFLAALFDGKLVSENSLDEMKTTIYAWDDFEYGLGLIRTTLTSGRAILGHSGLSAGFTTAVFYWPGDSTTVAILANDASAVLSPLIDDLIDEYLKQ